MDLSPGWVGAGCTVISLVGGGLVAWVRGEIAAVKGTQKVLFEKNDKVGGALQEYKLHVAETYVNREVLKEQLEPIHKTLEEIKDDLREEHRKG